MRNVLLAIVLVTIAPAACADIVPAPQSEEEPVPQSAETPAQQPPSFFRTIMSGLFGSSPPSNAPFPEPAMPPDLDPFAEPVEVQPAENAKVDIQTDYDIALREAQLRNRPLLVVFGATWCQWCRKLEDDLGKPEAQSLLTEWVIVKVDVDANPELAARLEASALPALRILDPLEKRVASQEGYLEPAALAEWLAANRKSADPILQRALFDTAPPDDAAVEQLVALLAEANPATRSAAMTRLAAHPAHTAPALVQTVKSGRLIQQLSACDILKKWDAPIRQIDPWRPETFNDAEFASLVTWSKERKTTIEPSNSAVPEGDTEAIAEPLDRLVRADANQRQGLIAQCIGIGPSVAVEVRKRLLDTDSANDASREALRELLYNLLASRELRLKQPGVLAALARLDAESHRRAAEVILRQAVSDDQPLVDELSHDADPLVREIAVMALGRLGMLVDGERIEPLLKDSSPNVRTAVLRALAEHPSDQTIQALCNYLKRETNEDLLVHGAKSLGQLSQKEEALATLAILAGNASWRVRAAAIDAVGHIPSASFQTMTTYNLNGDAETRIVTGGAPLPEALTSAIVAAAFEQDKFVAERALQLLPKIISHPKSSEATLENIAVALADHPDRFQILVGQHPANQRSQSFAPLVKLAREWFADENGKRAQQAAVLLSRLAPNELNDQLPILIASDNRSLRLAGMQAAIDSTTDYRQQSLAAARRAWASGPHEETITPWYELPKGHEPASPKVAPPDENSEVDLFEPPDLFGAARSAPPQVPAKPTVAANDAIDSVEALFGAPPPPAPAISDPVSNDPSPPPARGPRALGNAALALPSKWLEHWQSNPEERPDWLAKCDAPTQKHLESDDSRERALAQTLWLILGHTDRIEELFASRNALREADRAAAENLNRVELYSWLPSEPRLAELKQQLATLDGELPEVKELLIAVTKVDDPVVADWLFDALDQPPLSDSHVDSSLADLVIRARLGIAAEDLPTYFEAENFQYGSEPHFRVLEAIYTHNCPGRVAACEWLRERFHGKASERQRAVALSALAKLDHQAAVDAAIGVILAAESESQLLDVALTIALYDAQEPSAERAVGLLSHAAPSVQQAALRALAAPNAQFARTEEQAVPVVDVPDKTFPGLWLATQDFPKAALRKLVSDGDAEQQTQAKLLLLAEGEETDIVELAKQYEKQFPNYGQYAVAVALARTLRTDKEALKQYEAVYENAIDDYVSANLYEVIRPLKGEEAAKLRRRMRAEMGARLFNSGPNVIPPPTIRY